MALPRYNTPPSYSRRNDYAEPPGFADSLTAGLPSQFSRGLSDTTSFPNFEDEPAYSTSRDKKKKRRRPQDVEWYHELWDWCCETWVAGKLKDRWRRFRWIDLLGVKTLIILVWVWTLYWGERTVFTRSLESCAWNQWEGWSPDASPHHVVFIADPQLVDPHTYVGRPWPLSSLTYAYTDQYMRRTHSLIQQNLQPDTLYFLGDLFDGGREWETQTSRSPDPRWHGYDDDFWRGEYERFDKIYFQHWNDGLDGTAKQRDQRRMIASLPGNHDLGFGSGIQMPVMRRFQAMFGDGNRVDVVGNHSFVSINSVALSAVEQPEPPGWDAASLGPDDDKTPPNMQISGGTVEFLKGVKQEKTRLLAQHLRYQSGKQEHTRFPHKLVMPDVKIYEKEDHTSLAELPTILLTHVPLYRRPGTLCGPLRERYPPSSMDPLPESDDRNAISVSGGYQYQNVLTPSITEKIVSSIASASNKIAHVYSGDDHDYCELAHREFSGSPKEITVKSTSWAMGVRKPGFLLTSLWHPIDPETGATIETGEGKTVQNHLCLLPDQLGIFISYVWTLAITLVILGARAVFLVYRRPPAPSAPSSPSPNHINGNGNSNGSSFPPIAEKPSSNSYPQNGNGANYSTPYTTYNTTKGTTSSTSSRGTPTRTARSSSISSQQKLSTNIPIYSPRSRSPSYAYRGSSPATPTSATPTNDEAGSSKYRARPRRSTMSLIADQAADGGPGGGGGMAARRIKSVLKEFASSVILVGSFVFGWYFFLILRW